MRIVFVLSNGYHEFHLNGIRSIDWLWFVELRQCIYTQNGVAKSINKLFSFFVTIAINVKMVTKCVEIVNKIDLLVKHQMNKIRRLKHKQNAHNKFTNELLKIAWKSISWFVWFVACQNHWSYTEWNNGNNYELLINRSIYLANKTDVLNFPEKQNRTFYLFVCLFSFQLGFEHLLMMRKHNCVCDF